MSILSLFIILFMTIIMLICIGTPLEINLVLCVLVFALLYCVLTKSVILPGDIYINNASGEVVIVEDVLNDAIVYRHTRKGWHLYAHCIDIATFNKSFTKYQEE